jgi:hypothetical protein
MGVDSIGNLALLAAAPLPSALPALYLSHSCPAAPAHSAAAAATAAPLCRLALQRPVSAAAALCFLPGVLAFWLVRLDQRATWVSRLRRLWHRQRAPRHQA